MGIARRRYSAICCKQFFGVKVPKQNSKISIQLANEVSEIRAYTQQNARELSYK
jgi:hypothetical protein